MKEDLYSVIKLSSAAYIQSLLYDLTKDSHMSFSEGFTVDRIKQHLVDHKYSAEQIMTLEQGVDSYYRNIKNKRVYRIYLIASILVIAMIICSHQSIIGGLEIIIGIMCLAVMMVYAISWQNRVANISAIVKKTILNLTVVPRKKPEDKEKEAGRFARHKALVNQRFFYSLKNISS